MSHWDFVLTEGDLQAILKAIEARRDANPDTAYCFQISIDAVPDGVSVEMGAKASIEELHPKILREMFEKGQI